MKTKFKIFNILLVLTVFAFMACEKQYETEDLSTITNYPVFEVSGDAVMAIEKGTAFVEPGVKAVAGADEVPVDVTVEGLYTGYKGTTVNTDVPDRYLITYTATNSDGFKRSVERTVWVAATGDLTTSIEGLYTATVSRSGAFKYADLEYVLIRSLGGNTYTISDVIAGYYDFWTAYGIGYAAIGMKITANDISANDFTFGSSVPVGLFGGTCDMTSMTVDAASKSIDYEAKWVYSASFQPTYAVTLKQVQL